VGPQEIEKLLHNKNITKEMATKLKRLPIEWEKNLCSYTSDRRLIIRIYRELKKLNSPKSMP
jgi:hypothetical protein